MKEIILVDDNKMFLETLKEFVQNINKEHTCIAFSNPKEALQYVIMKKDIHAVVSDYEMPEMNGLIFAKKIIHDFPKIKVIVMSGHDTNYLREKASEEGIVETQIQLLCKSNIIDLYELLYM